MITRNSVGGAYPIKTLGDVVEFLDSKRRPVTESDRQAGSYPYYGANGKQGTIDNYIFDEPLVLLAEDGGHFDDPERGIAYRISGKTWVNNHAHVLRPKQGLDLVFLCRVLENYDVSPFVTGTTRGKLTKAGASEIPIPIPPHPEQIRIASILDQADALRGKRKEALAHMDSLAQAIFIEMFGDPVENPKGFTRKTLGELVKFEGGSQPPASVFTSVASPESIRLVQIRDFKSDRFKTFIPRKLARRYFEEDDVMIGRYGPPVFQILKGLSGSYNVALMKAVPREGVTKNFVYYLLQEKRLHNFVVANSERTAGQSGVNLELLEKYEAYQPPEDLQREFSKRVDAVDKLKKAQLQSLAEMENLFASLQHRAFRGEL